MVVLAALGLWLGCTRGPEVLENDPAPALGALELGAGGATRIRLLDHLADATLELPEGDEAQAGATVARWDPTASGLEPRAFVDLQATKGRQMRRSLLLPAPGRARFPVEVPPGARLRFGWTALAPNALAPLATAGVRLLADGEELWSGKARSDAEWKDTSIDLRRFAGKTVTLEWVTDPQGDPAGDAVVIANPEVVGEARKDGPRRIVVIGVDTLRQDHVGVHGAARPTTPGMDSIAAQSVVFDHAWAPAPRTRPSFRTATTGRWPREAVGAPSIGQILGQHGWATAGIVANLHLSPRLGFADGFDWWETEASALADTQVDRALRWLVHHRDEDSFLFLHLMDPHLHYAAPEPYRDRFTTGLPAPSIGERYNRWWVMDAQERGDLDPRTRQFIEARYDGEVAWTDTQVVRLVKELDALPGRTLVLIHTDHGEEFWDHGAFEHNHTLYDELVRAVLWVRPPGGAGGGPHRVVAPVGLVDIASTLLDAADVPATAWPKQDGVSLRPFFDARAEAKRAPLQAALENRPLQLGHLMFQSERWGVVASGHKYILETVSGREELYDLTRDQDEQKDLAGLRDLEPWRRALAQATGFEVGTGWRIRFDDLEAPVALVFDEPVRAGVFDPEAATARRGDPEWGETPQRRPDDAATVSVEGNTVTLTPGLHPSGTAWVLGPGPATEASLGSARGDASVLSHPGLTIQPGTLVIVPTDAQVTADDLDPRALEELRALGYVQ